MSSFLTLTEDKGKAKAKVRTHSIFDLPESNVGLVPIVCLLDEVENEQRIRVVCSFLQQSRMRDQ